MYKLVYMNSFENNKFTIIVDRQTDLRDEQDDVQVKINSDKVREALKTFKLFNMKEIFKVW